MLDVNVSRLAFVGTEKDESVLAFPMNSWHGALLTFIVTRCYFFPSTLPTREGWTLTPAGWADRATAVSFIKRAKCLTITACLSPDFAPKSASTGSSHA